MSSFCGIDFGTSNSVVTLLDGERRVVIREPSLIFFAEDTETTTDRSCGERALTEYVARGTRGRFFQSVKSILPDPGFTHTTINGKRFTAEDLVAVMLRFLREQAESGVGKPIRRAVLGRPASWSDQSDRDALAQGRLERAAHQAGFDEVRFELEPIGGARAYAAGHDASARGEEIVFVADHGGGTSDFTVLRVGPGPGGLPAAKEILATHGLRAGGDDFDAAIMWNRLVAKFGHGSHFESFGRYLPVPVHIFHIISRWDQIHFLKTLSYREELRTYLRTSDNPVAIRRLMMLVEENLGYFIFQAIERAKIELSVATVSRIEYHRERLRIGEELTRSEFESYIGDHIDRIRDGVEETLRLAGAPRIDRVFLTGGSSRVPAVRRVLADRLGADRIVDDVDEFRSVSLGLAITAREAGFTSTSL